MTQLENIYMLYKHTHIHHTLSSIQTHIHTSYVFIYTNTHTYIIHYHLLVFAGTCDTHISTLKHAHIQCQDHPKNNAHCQSSCRAHGTHIHTCTNMHAYNISGSAKTSHIFNVPLHPLWAPLPHAATQGTSTSPPPPPQKHDQSAYPKDEEPTGVASFQDAEHAPFSGAVSAHIHEQTDVREQHAMARTACDEQLEQKNVSHAHDDDDDLGCTAVDNSRSGTDPNTGSHTENHTKGSESENSPAENEDIYTGRTGFRRAVLQVTAAAQMFNPDLVLVSAGFDAALGDEGNCVEGVAGTDLLPEDYAFATKAIRDMAQACCGGRVVSVLEGGYGSWDDVLQGYDRDVLVRCCMAHVHALAEPP
jgi:hypothetical protein